MESLATIPQKPLQVSYVGKIPFLPRKKEKGIPNLTSYEDTTVNRENDEVKRSA
jgi:hypothetical protein